MFILFTEDGQLYQTAEFSDDDKAACDNGIMDCVDTKTMKQWYDGAWHDVAKLETC